MAAPHPLSAVPDKEGHLSAAAGHQPAGAGAHDGHHHGHGDHAHHHHHHHHHHHGHDHHRHDGAEEAAVQEPRRIGASRVTAAPPVVSALTMSAGARVAVAGGLTVVLWALMAWAMA